MEKGRAIMATLRKPHLVKYTPAPGEDPLSDAHRRASWLGFVTGLRSMTPSALLAWTSDRPSTALKAFTGFLAVGEFVGDKLPMTPSRLNEGPFLGRIAFGALAGALVSRRFHQAPLQGAIRGAIGAAVGTVVGSSYRSLAAQGLGIPDVVAALVEDSVALTVGLRAVGTVPSVAQLGIHRPDLAELTE